LVRRSDLDAVKSAMEAAGFVFRHSSGIDMFLDGPGAKARDAVHIVFANEKVRPDYSLPAPDVSESEPGKTFRTLSLEPLARMKLTSFRKKDRMHIRDMLDVGLLDASWPAGFPREFAERLYEILATPEG